MESLVLDRLSQNWIAKSRNIKDRLSLATLHPMLWLSIVGHYTIVWHKKTRLFSTNFAIGFLAESWSLGSSTISLSSWIARKDLYQNHTLSYKKPQPPSPTHDAEICQFHLSMMTSSKLGSVNDIFIKFGLYIKTLLTFYLYR